MVTTGRRVSVIAYRRFLRVPTAGDEEVTESVWGTPSQGRTPRALDGPGHERYARPGSAER